MNETHNQAESDLPAQLSQPARRALLGAGCLRLEQVAAMSETELKKLHGMGPKGIEMLRQALAERGLTFARK
jgi:DNA-directed RNA polymerase alpha subunit